MQSLERLSDLDELVLRCRTDRAREYLAESVACYRAGAFRAAIATAWIAVVFDLIDKIRELSVAGDGMAQSLLTQFENYQRQIDLGNAQAIKLALEFERDILIVVRDKLQLFDQQQFLDMSRLREDRHRCAHPTFHRLEDPYRPSAEQARVHIRNAIAHVLSQPPVQGKVALAQLRTLVASQYFPDEPEKARTQLLNTPLAKPSESLIKAFVDLLTFDFFEDGQPLKFSHRVIAALNALLSMHRAVAEPRFRQQLNKVIHLITDKDFLGAAVMALDVDGAWDLLDQASRDKVAKYIETGPAKEVVAFLALAARIDALKPSVTSRLNALNVAELSEAVISYGLTADAVPRAVDLYTSVGSWVRANELTDKLMLPLLPYLSEAQIEEIVRSPKEKGADLPGSTGFSKFLEKIRESQRISTARLDDILKEVGLEHYASNPDIDA